MYATISWPKGNNLATCSVANQCFPYQHPKLWWPINDMNINSIKEHYEKIVIKKCLREFNSVIKESKGLSLMF